MLAIFHIENIPFILLVPTIIPLNIPLLAQRTCFKLKFKCTCFRKKIFYAMAILTEGNLSVLSLVS